MNFPLISEYVEAVKMAEDNFDELCHLRPVLDKDGQPVMSSGNFALVFKMRDTESGKFHAVRCFHREQEGRAESYRQIEEALRQVQSPYLVSFRYMDKELFVDSKQTGDETEFPVLLMDWVEGVTLDRYIREHINDRDALEVLAYRFSLMASWIIAQPFAHGDLKPDNILVRPDGTITLVDYDGMFVPSMQGQTARELGSPDFRHPLRTEEDFDGSIDDFPLISILLSLKTIAVNPSLLDQFGASDRLLFSEADYRDISKCRVLHEIFPSVNNELNTLVGVFTLALNKGRLVGFVPTLLILSEPQCLLDEQLSTGVTDKDWEDAIEDEFGATYSEDRKRLLEGVKIKEYVVREGTKIICDEAFVIYLIDYDDMDYVDEPALCASENNIKRIHIPNGVLKIGKKAFLLNSKLNSIDIPDSVKEIGDEAFANCYELTKVHLSNNVNEIRKGVFRNCYNLIHVHIPDGVTKIGDIAFEECQGLISVYIPNSVTEIGKGAFRNCCPGLTSIHIPDGVTKIGDAAFGGCEEVVNIHIPDSVTEIGKGAFYGCHKLNSIYIPNGIKNIEDAMFMECWSLTSVRIPNSVTKIGVKAFYGCSSLISIHIPDSVMEIGNGAFDNCSSLERIIVSHYTKKKFENLLMDYKDIIVELNL